MVQLIEEEILSKAINELLTYLSKKYNVSKPYWVYSRRIKHKAIYDPKLKLIAFNVVSPEIITHEFFHHYCNERNILETEELIIKLTNKEISSLEKESAIPELWKQHFLSSNPITLALPITYSVLSVAFGLSSLISKEKEEYTIAGIFSVLFGILGIASSVLA